MCCSNAFTNVNRIFLFGSNLLFQQTVPPTRSWLIVMMNPKALGVGLTGKRHRRNDKSAVLHNGSFITEAFPVKSQDTYDEVEEMTIDSCLPYPGYSPVDTSVTVESVDDISHDHDMNTVTETHELTSVEQIFSICSDNTARSQDFSASSEDISKNVVGLPYNNVAMVTDSQDSGSQENIICDSFTSQTCVEVDKSSELLNSGSSICVYPKNINTTTSAPPICIVASPRKVWPQRSQPTDVHKTVDISNVPLSKSEMSSTNIANNSFSHCTVDSNGTESSLDKCIADNSPKTFSSPILNGYMTNLLQLSTALTPGVEASQSNHGEQLHIVNAVTTADGAIEIVDSDGR